MNASQDSVFEVHKHISLAGNSPLTNSSIVRWFVGKVATNGHSYLRNDGAVLHRMAINAHDTGGGTYHPTKGDAQASLDRYIKQHKQKEVYHSTEDTDVKGNT